MRSGTVLAALILGSTFLSPPAWAEAIARAGANSGVESAAADSADNSALANEPHVSARARATELSANALSAAGAIDSCFQAGSPSPGCATVGTEISVTSYASANGNQGTLKASARASDGGHGSATAVLIDTITLASPVIDILLDLNSFTGALAQSPGQVTGSSSVFFSLFLDNRDDPNPDAPQSILLFTLEAFKDETESGFAAYLMDDPDGGTIDSGNSIPDSFHYEIDLTDPAFASLFGPIAPGFPSFYDLGEPLPLGFMLHADASCSSNCFAEARIDKTLYIELEGESANGYAYPGKQIVVDPPPTGIPEPATALLLLAGIAGLAAGARRR